MEPMERLETEVEETEVEETEPEVGEAEATEPEAGEAEATEPEVGRISPPDREGFGGPGFSPAVRSLLSGALAPEEIGPKRSESSTAMGRAPIVKMSRRIPPTPVAAP